MMQDEPKFMSGRWQRKLQKERPGLFLLVVVATAFPILFGLRLGLNGMLGSAVQTGLYIFVGLLAVVLLGLVIDQRMRRKEHGARIDAYLDHRYEQTHEKDPKA
jgi:bacteriorhodopsin